MMIEWNGIFIDRKKMSTGNGSIDGYVWCVNAYFVVFVAHCSLLISPFQFNLLILIELNSNNYMSWMRKRLKIKDWRCKRWFSLMPAFIFVIQFSNHRKPFRWLHVSWSFDACPLNESINFNKMTSYGVRSTHIHTQIQIHSQSKQQTAMQCDPWEDRRIIKFIMTSVVHFHLVYFIRIISRLMDSIHEFRYNNGCASYFTHLC